MLFFNILLNISYNGSHFCGYQKQPYVRTVQGDLEKTLYNIMGEEVKTYAAGRTDSGVHAVRQYVNFHIAKEKLKFPFDRFAPILNNYLSKDIRVLFSKEVPQDFHARFSAVERCYKYYLYAGKCIPSAYAHDTALIPSGLHIASMEKELKELEGEHDFATFAAKEDGLGNTVRVITHASLCMQDDKLVCTIVANSFLWNMVRGIIGTVVDIAKMKMNKKNTMTMREILLSKERKFCGAVVPSHALFLYEVQYDAKFGISSVTYK